MMCVCHSNRQQSLKINYVYYNRKMTHEQNRAELINEINEVRHVLPRQPLAEEFANCICLSESPKLYARCPYCDEIHQHGSEAGIILGKVGWRLSHCESNKRMYYLQIVGISPRKNLKQALRTLRN